MAALDDYLDLVPTQNRAQINFISVLTTILQPFVDIQNNINEIPALYDVDEAVGVQLDTTGQWIGQSRNISIPLVGVYFAFDIASVGFDQGTWKGPDDPENELTSLPDADYRTLLKAKIGANYWDGTKTQANEIWDKLFLPMGIKILTIDYNDMTMDMIMITDTPLTAVLKALFQNGYIKLKPAGVRVKSFLIAGSDRVFGFDVNNEAIGGFDIGAWKQPITDRLGIDFVLGFSKLGF